MPHILKRPSGRFSAYYTDSTGKRRSAGTYDTYEEAMLRGKDREGEAPTQRVRRTGNSPLLYRDWVLEWISTDEDEDDKDSIGPRTKMGYANNLRTHVLPILGDYRIVDIEQDTIRMMLRTLKKKGLSAQVRAQCKAAVGRTFHALVPAVVPINPTHGVLIDLPPAKEFRLITPEHFRRIHEQLPNEGARLFATFLVTTGTRFGEATEVRVRDLNFDTREVRIERRVVSVSGLDNKGSRFQVLGGTKAGGRHGRTIVMPPALSDALREWISTNDLSPYDLLFPKKLIGPGDLDDAFTVEPGSTFTKAGRNYKHGTPGGYSAGGCRCEHCRVALRQYRRALARRRLTNDRPSPQGRNLTGHLCNDHWRKIWRQAVKKARIGWEPRTHDLRHACATHLVSSGVSLFEVMSIMGHRNVETTLRYQHRVDRMQSRAVDVVAEFLGTEEEV